MIGSRNTPDRRGGRMTSRSLLALTLSLALGAAAPPLAQAQLYRWTNERGEVHFTQGLETVPERFRQRARLLGYPEAPPASPAEPPSAAPPSARGLTRIPFVPGSPILVDARLNGGRSARLILDTGASATMISPRTLSALGVDMSGARPAEVRGVTGTASARAVYIESIEVGAAKAGPLWVLAHDAGMLQGDGLLGRDFLDRFKITIDTRERVVTLGER